MQSKKRDAPGRAVAEVARTNFSAMREEWLVGWKSVFGKTLAADVLAGVTVAAVALPLNIGLAKQSGMPASAGLIAGAVGGILAGAFGGSNIQVTGPAAALTTMVFGIATNFGPSGVAAACVIVGIVQVALAFGGLGKYIQKIPESVLAGFTTGVGLKLLDQQLPEALGFEQMGANYKFIDMAAMMHKPQWLHHVNWHTAACALIVGFFVTRLKAHKRVPAALIGMALVTGISVYLHWDIERVGQIPSSLPHPSLPDVDDDKLLDLVLATLPLALLASAETLLSARAVDRLVPEVRKHHPSLELFGQGVANFAVGFFGGVPVSGVPARSGANAQSGGRTRLAALVHGLILVLTVYYMSKQIAMVPIAALAGLLIVIGLRLIEIQELYHLAKTKRIEALAFVVTMAGTVSGHLMFGLALGIALTAAQQYLDRGEAAAARLSDEAKSRGARAIVSHEHDEGRKLAHWQAGPVDREKWLRNLRSKQLRASTSYVHEQASVVGHVFMGEHVHVAAGSSVRADEGTPFYIGANTNLQDGVIVHALKDKHVLVAGEPWAVYVGKNVSIAHNAIVHGPCYIGDETFVGFKAIVHDSVVGAHCFIGHGAIVVGVEIPEGRLVPSGRIVDSADAVLALPLATEHHHEFNEDVVEVNRGLAVAYQAMDDRSSAPTKRVVASSVPVPLAVWEEAWAPTHHQVRLGKDRF